MQKYFLLPANRYFLKNSSEICKFYNKYGYQNVFQIKDFYKFDTQHKVEFKYADVYLNIKIMLHTFRRYYILLYLNNYLHFIFFGMQIPSSDENCHFIDYSTSKRLFYKQILSLNQH